MRPKEINSIDPYDWTEILESSLSEGHHMVHRLVTDFRAGTNRFDAPGESLFAHIDGNAVVAVGGVNVDEERRFGSAGRVRRLYVIPRCRGNGLARSLLNEIIVRTFRKFDVLTVNVGKLDARGFYEHFGFTPIEHTGITHVKQLAHNKASYAIGAKRASV
jgi:GNAT superfamily N-acetyltransferase